MLEPATDNVPTFSPGGNSACAITIYLPGGNVIFLVPVAQLFAETLIDSTLDQ